MSVDQPVATASASSLNPTAAPTPAPVVPRVFRVAMAQQLQWRHFVDFYLLPNIAVVVLLPVFGLPTSVEVCLFLGMWLATCLGVSVGFHRLFTHKAFKTYASIEGALAVLGMMAAGGSVVSWVGIHRRHHERTDEAGDPHSPLGSPPVPRMTWWSWIAGMVHAHGGWMRRHDYPNPLFYTRDLFRKRWLLAINRRYQWWVLLGIILPGVVNGIVEWNWMSIVRGMYFGGLLRMVLVHHIISSINSICHGIGWRRYSTNDQSTNCWWLAIPTVGEAWHNNHHRRQASAYFGHVWWEIDLGGYFVRLLGMMGLAWDIHGPNDFGQNAASRP